MFDLADDMIDLPIGRKTPPTSPDPGVSARKANIPRAEMEPFTRCIVATGQNLTVAPKTAAPGGFFGFFRRGEMLDSSQPVAGHDPCRRSCPKWPKTITPWPNSGSDVAAVEGSMAA